MEIHIYDHAKHQHLLPAFGDIHVACMEHDRTVATILTYDREKATKIYRACAEETLVSSQSFEAAPPKGSRCVIDLQRNKRDPPNDFLAALYRAYERC